MDRTINQIAKLVIGLHEQGYNNDFKLSGNDRIWDAQECQYHVLGEININMIYQIGNQAGKSAKFILAVETGEGCKGLLVANTLERDFLSYK